MQCVIFEKSDPRTIGLSGARKKSGRIPSQSNPPDPIDSDDPYLITSLAKNLDINRPTYLLQRRLSPSAPIDKGLWLRNQSSSEDEKELAGRIRLPLPEMLRGTRSSKSTHLPKFLK